MVSASSTSPASPAADPPPLEAPQWLKTLPLAPEYHPSLADFQDPIAYILKIEKEASRYGICKIVPPLPAAPRKTAVSNLNRSFAARGGGAGGSSGSKKGSPTFTTRQQQIGFCPRRPRPVQKPVWQSGERYTLQQFEAKSKQFEKTQLKRSGRKGGGSFSPLEVETLFWKASTDKPFSVEYANDMPGSGFAPLPPGGAKKMREEDGGNVGDTSWNMRGVSREKGSLLKFMKEDIPGVTSPMVYVAMMFSWFAWHVEDHELHSLNYLHMGAGKTWYGVPRDARLAFEEVVRMHGYGGEVNPLVTFAILGEKTTVMSPEVLVGAGVPCCRLVQNAGDFIVTFPGAYHSGFSLGFNCGEAANIATPEWLKVAKEAAVRRASINHPPMVSHYQLLYELALSMCSRIPMNSGTVPRSSRLKDKMKGEGEIMIKELFIQNVIRNNDHLHILLNKGSSCVVLPPDAFDVSLGSNSYVRSQMKVKPRLSLGLRTQEEALEASRVLPSDDLMLDKNVIGGHLNGFTSIKGNQASVCQEKRYSLLKYNKSGNSDSHTSTSESQNMDSEKESTLQCGGLLDQGLLSCVTCGILSFACIAIIQPTDAAAVHLMSTDCSSFNDHSFDFGVISGVDSNGNAKAGRYGLTAGSGKGKKNSLDGFHYDLANSSIDEVQVSDQMVDSTSKTVQKGVSALDLLASAYGDLSDSDEGIQPEIAGSVDRNDPKDSLLESSPNQQLYHSQDVQSQDLDPGEVSCKEEPCMCRTDMRDEAAQILSKPSLRLVSCCGPGDICEASETNTEDKCGPWNLAENTESLEPKNLESEQKMDASDRLDELVGIAMSTEKASSELGISLTAESSEFHQSDGEMERLLNDSVRHPGSPDSCYDKKTTPDGNATIITQLRKPHVSVNNSSLSFMHRPDKDSSRMHIFCLEHAIEVERLLHPTGGVHMMIVCHPDYPKIEAEAKSVAEELRVDYTWKDIHFKQASKEDHNKIQSALEDEEAVPVNSDWSVKMGLNLYFSANLSKTPLYSKQMAYNVVIYKAFGRDSSGGSPGKPKLYGRRHGREKKIVVAGKWCGKVWMSNQVHPYLAYRNDPEEEEEEAEKFCVDTTNGNLVDNYHAKQVRTPRRNSLDISRTTASRSTRKRKKSLEKSNAKKLKFTKPETDKTVENSILKSNAKKSKFTKPETDKTVENLIENSSARSGRRLRSGRIKKRLSSSLQDDFEETPRCSKFSSEDDDDDGGPSTRLRKRQTKTEGSKIKKPVVEKQIKKKERKASGKNSVAENNGAEYPCDMEGCTMSFSLKQDLALHKRNICHVKGCGKKLFSHKYLVQHHRVHLDDRPLKCPWKGCRMTFKWAWARTEHIRVHTGARPYVCREAGCGQTFRFVSDFSRHKRKTGHVSKKGRG